MFCLHIMAGFFHMNFFQDILAQSELYHLYMKHIFTLESADIKLVHDICASFDTVLLMLDSASMTEIVNQVMCL